MRQRAGERLVDDVTRLSHGRLALGPLIDEAGSAIARTIPHLGACWHTMDPATLIETRFRTVNLPPHGARIAEYEYVRTDFNKFVELARGPRHSGVLSEATGGDLRRSARYRDFFQEQGIRGELRASLVAGGACWGSFALFREAPADFTGAERDLAHRIAVILGRGFRAAIGRAITSEPAPAAAPGLVMLDDEGRIESLTAAARGWLEQLRFGGEPTFDGLPHALLAVAQATRASGCDATARLPGVGGEWIQLHASPAWPGVADEAVLPRGRVAVIVQAAAAPTMAPLIAAAYGLTSREWQLTELVLQGHSTARIATRLHISPHTVQEHLKSIFAKAGVRSRRDLVGRLFRRHYQAQSQPVDPNAP
jgi:DNA-binding CsgD family transcriptional regulator